MTSLILTALLLQAATAQTPAPANAPAPPPYKISGTVFGDYYGFAEHHLPEWEGQHGFWLRRVYLTYDHTLSESFAMRLRLEMNSNGKLAGGSLTPYVKDAYLRWNVHGRQALTLGIQPSLTFDFVESVWGLRHVEKTPLDLYRWDSSRDTGVTLSGPVNAAGTAKYAVQAGNDSGNNAETDAQKGFRASARYEPKQGLAVEVMAGHANRANDADRTTAQVFAGWRAPRLRAGAQYSFQRRRSTAGETDLDLVSGFGVFAIRPRLEAFARVDRVADSCADCGAIDYLPIATTHPFTTVIAGVDYALHSSPQSSVRISPNVEWVHYRDGDAGGAMGAPVDDKVLRLTFSWNF